MHRLWHQLLRKFRLLSRPERAACLSMALLGLGAIGWVVWTELATTTPPSISMTTLVEDARKGQIQSASISKDAIELVYRDGWEASFRGQLPDETLVQLVQAGVDVSFGGSAFTDFLSKNGFALLMLRRFEGSPFKFAMGMMLTGAFATMWMPNQATTAMLFPIAMEVCAALRLRPKESEYAKVLFFAMAWGAMVGGNMTFLGSSRAALALGMLQRNFNTGISFTEWMLAAFPLVVLGVVTTPSSSERSSGPSASSLPRAALSSSGPSLASV
ncbi:MAG: hypothetical protein HC869_25840, partial [Rhodospirillales bacterium]|nr:hypothetical protein [Rhodospirillales bacterium]